MSDCPSCGAPAEASRFRCTYCDSPLPGMDGVRERRADELVKFLEEELGARYSRRVDAVGCLYFLAIPSAFVIARRFGCTYTQSLMWLFGVTLVGLIGFGSMIMAEQRIRYKKKIRPQVVAFLQESAMGPADFLARARAVLEGGEKKKSVLLKHLPEIVKPGAI